MGKFEYICIMYIDKFIQVPPKTLPDDDDSGVWNRVRIQESLHLDQDAQ